MAKVVYNACFGGFGVSESGYLLYCEKSGITPNITENIYYNCWSAHHVDRHDANLVQVVEELGDKASAPMAKLRISEGEGPYRIDDYDGNETVVWRDDNTHDEWITP